MRRKALLLLNVFILMTLIVSACAQATPEPEEGETEGFVRGVILQRVKDRGKLVCGGRTDLPGSVSG